MADTGMELRDLLYDTGFQSRPARVRPGLQNGLNAFNRLAVVLASKPDAILQELVEVAIEFCGADSCGISLEEATEGERRFRWVAIAGSFSQFLNGTTPRFFSPCGTTLTRGQPQLYRVTKRYYDLLGITAEPIHDGILIPWEVDSVRGTIWAVSHGSRETFDYHDYELLDSAARFVTLAIQRQNIFRRQERLAAYAELANELAHEINNPLQGAISALYLAEHMPERELFIHMAADELQRVSQIVRKLPRFRNARLDCNDSTHSPAA